MQMLSLCKTQRDKKKQFSRRQAENTDLDKNHNKQNNNHTGSTHKIKFQNSFTLFLNLKSFYNTTDV